MMEEEENKIVSGRMENDTRKEGTKERAGEQRLARL